MPSPSLSSCPFSVYRAFLARGNLEGSCAASASKYWLTNPSRHVRSQVSAALAIPTSAMPLSTHRLWSISIETPRGVNHRVLSVIAMLSLRCGEHHHPATGRLSEGATPHSGGPSRSIHGRRSTPGTHRRAEGGAEAPPIESRRSNSKLVSRLWVELNWKSRRARWVASRPILNDRSRHERGV